MKAVNSESRGRRDFIRLVAKTAGVAGALTVLPGLDPGSACHSGNFLDGPLRDIDFLRIRSRRRAGMPPMTNFCRSALEMQLRFPGRVSATGSNVATRDPELLLGKIGRDIATVLTIGLCCATRRSGTASSE